MPIAADKADPIGGSTEPRELCVGPHAGFVALESQWVSQPISMEPTGMERSAFLGLNIQKDELIQGEREKS